MEYAVYALYAIVAGLAIYAFASAKAPKTKPAALDEFNVPTAIEGRPYPRLYGKDWFTDPNWVWHGDLLVETETQNHERAIFYSLGGHLEFMQGQPDELCELRAEDTRTFWRSTTATAVTASGTITVNEPNLFGGRASGGGIVGEIDVLFGEETQGVNAYLASVLPGPLPAMRGVAGLVYKQIRITANSPFVAPHAARWKRIYNGWYGEVDQGDACWYPETAEVGTPDLLSFDLWCQGLDGDPRAVESWWKLTGLDTTFPNVGVSGPAMTLVGDLTSTHFEDPSLLFPGVTVNDASIRRTGGYGSGLVVPGITANRDGFFVHGAVDFMGFDEQILFKSHRNGQQGYWRGIDVFRPDGNSLFLQVVLGDNAGGNRRYSTPTGSITDSGVHYWALVFNGGDFEESYYAGDSSRRQWRMPIGDGIAACDMYIDGALQTLTLLSEAGAPVYLVFPEYETGSDPDGFDGISFDGTGDTYGATPGMSVGQLIYWPKPDDATEWVDALYIFEMNRRARGAFRLDGDMNPAHVCYDVITNPHSGMGRPIAEIEDASFRAGALVHWEEYFGITTKNNRQGPSSEFLKAIEEVADSVCDVDPITGLWYYTPMRGDYDVSDLPVFDEVNILKVENFTAHAYGRIPTRVIVKYKDPETAKPAETRWDNPATYGAQYGRLEISEFEAPQIRQHALAGRVCAREGMKQTHELRAFTATVNRDGYGLRRGRVINCSWQKLGMDGVICRVIAVNYGNVAKREIVLGLIEDVYGLPESNYIAPQTSQWTEPNFDALPPEFETSQELPRWMVREAIGEANVLALPDAAGFAFPMGVQPSGLSTGYDLWREAIGGGPVLEKPGAIWNRSAVLGANLAGAPDNLDMRTVYVDQSTLTFGTVVAGNLLQLGEGPDAEIVRVRENHGGTIWVTGGHLDTTPKQLTAAGTRVWLLPEPGAFLDDTQYTDGDTAVYRLLTNTGGDQLDYDEANVTQVDLASRAVRPIAPGDVRINALAWPTALVGPLLVEFSGRDKTLQVDTTAQSDDAVDWPAGVTVSGWAYADETDVLVDSATGLVDTWIPTIAFNGRVRIELAAVDGEARESWQRQKRAFDYTGVEGILDAGGDYLLDADGGVILEANP